MSVPGVNLEVRFGESPDSLDAMSQIKGVGSFKLHKYGRQFVGAIQSYIDNH